jgi:hypothetical protein
MSSPTDLLALVRSHFDTPIALPSVSAAEEKTDARTITLQVVDRLRKPWKGLWLVELYLATTATGEPGGTQTVAFSTGNVTETIRPNQHWRVQTDTLGRIVFDVTITGAASRFVIATVLGRYRASSQIIWAA